MIINKISVKRFRGFEEVEFNLGTHLTVIAGQNGTQKTTLLGMLSQPFSITDASNPLYTERPLCGGNFKSAFSEKFKLSENFDTAKSHEWTLHLNFDEATKFTVESILRDKKSKEIRFWKKGNRDKGSGYIQRPVIFLSLSRLLPIGEDNALATDESITLTKEEAREYQELHNKILCIPDIELSSVNYLSSRQKNTLGANTDFYDWKMNSAGQDNIGKIILALLSFKRLKEHYPEDYQGGILAIDELDATLYPASQVKLLKVLMKYCSKYSLQIIFTTHSLNILENACELQSLPGREGQVNVVYLERKDKKVKATKALSFTQIQDKLNITISGSKTPIKKITFVEDLEAAIFLKAILKSRASLITIPNCNMGCANLIELARKKTPGFRDSEALIILDGDVRLETSKMSRINKLKSILILPGDNSPERLIAIFLQELSDNSNVWNDIYPAYTKQFAFQNHSLKEILHDRKIAKKWFSEQKQYWGRNCCKVINPWMKNHTELVKSFIEEFEITLSNLTI